MIRKPVVAGQFYPGSAAQLKSTIKKMVNESASKEDVIGLVMPHAGYVYSGPVAGASISRVNFKDTFIILGPNHTGMGKPMSIMTEGSWQTPLGEVEIDSELAKAIKEGSRYLEEDTEAHLAEHSIEVQLPFLQYFKSDIKIVPIILAHAPGEVYKNIGRAIAGAILNSNKDAVILASSDMTHYESQDSAKKKDTEAINAILELDADKLLKRVSELNITMCGYAPAVALITAAKELKATATELVKYQTSGDVVKDYSSVVGYAGILIKGTLMSPLVRLAHRSVESFVREGKVIKPGELAPEMKEKAGVFVSIYKRGELRGCIGTFAPTQTNVAQEIIHNAISSSTRDPRFFPITPEELQDLEISVDVLTSPVPVKSKAELDPKKYGAIVECGWRRGLLLPDLEGVDTVDEQINICCMKGGISPDEKLKLYRFEVKRYK
ncbi:MAG: AmmeMemoRadiSam system protein B [Chloroflexota bacterium]